MEWPTLDQRKFQRLYTTFVLLGSIDLRLNISANRQKYNIADFFYIDDAAQAVPYKYVSSLSLIAYQAPSTLASIKRERN